MKEHERTPAEKIVSWWKGDEGVEVLEEALSDESLSLEKSVTEAFLSSEPVSTTTSWQKRLSLAAGLFLQALLVLGIGFVGWSLWRLPEALPMPATPQEVSVLPQQLNQIQKGLEDLAARVATVETNRPTVAAMATVQAQVVEIQRALSATPTVTATATSSPTPTSTSTITPTITLTATLSLFATPAGPQGQYLGTVTPRTGPGMGSNGRGVYDESRKNRLQPNTQVTVLGRWIRAQDWLFVATSSPTYFFWVSDSVSYQGEVPAIALPWWKPTPAPIPWQETRIDDLFVYTISVADFNSASSSASARWGFSVVQDGEYAIEAWMPSESGALLTYRIETSQGENWDREVD